MTDTKPFTSLEIQKLVEHWQICHFFTLDTRKTIISLSHYELYTPISRLRCNPAALERIKTALNAAYQEGIREVGMIAPHALQAEITLVALSVTDDPKWVIYPRNDVTYFKNMLLTQAKIWRMELFRAETEVFLQEIEKDTCARMGFTDEVILELERYIHVEDVRDLPPHLRRLFADGQEPVVQTNQE